MPLEAVTHISDLNQTNPPGTDGLAQADDHIRNIKKALLTDLPGINGVVNATPAQLNLLNALAALAVLANATNGAAPPTAVVAASDGQVFLRAGAVLAFGAVDTTNPLAVKNPAIIARMPSPQILNLTSFVDLNGLTGIALETNTWYAFEAYIEVVNTSTGGFKAKGVFSNAPAVERTQATKSSTGVDTGNSLSFNDTIQNAGGFLVWPSSAGDTTTYEFKGRFLTNAVTGGTFKMQGAENAVLGTTTVQSGSYVILTKMS